MVDDELLFYEVSNKYIEYLKRFDNKIPNMIYENREKFVSGVLFSVNGMNYFAPVSSFNIQQKTNYLIKIGDYPVGSIRFSFMFPVPDNEIKLKPIELEQNKKYKSLLKSELSYCNEHKESIRTFAYRIYTERVYNKKSTFKNFCCDFKLLESKCIEWEKNRDKGVKQKDEKSKLEKLINHAKKDITTKNQVNKKTKVVEKER